MIRCESLAFRSRVSIEELLGYSRYFLEEDAIDKNGKLTREKSKAVNKIGHGACHSCWVPFVLLIPDSFLCCTSGLHILDPLFRKVTLENDWLKALVRDLKFHHDPVGESVSFRRSTATHTVFTRTFSLALQSMVITKQTHIGGEGK